VQNWPLPLPMAANMLRHRHRRRDGCRPFSAPRLSFFSAFGNELLMDGGKTNWRGTSAVVALMDEFKPQNPKSSMFAHSLPDLGRPAFRNKIPYNNVGSPHGV